MNTQQEGFANILIVDDTPANLTLLSEMLRKKGHKVRPVPSGRLAIQAAKKESPDLVLLDVNMPEMDGYEVCRLLKEDEKLKEIPVIFISALSDVFDKVRAFQAGGVDYIVKPFQVEEVDARVDTHLRIRRLQQESEERIELLTFFDPETGLPNRECFARQLESALFSSKPSLRRVVLLLIEVDELKILFRTIGKDKGDFLVRQVAGRIRENLLFDDLIGRIGFDEFGVVLMSLTSGIDVGRAIMEKFFRALSRPYFIEGSEVAVTVSVGVAFFPEDGKDCLSLFGNAATALTKAKGDGGNGYVFFSEEIRKRLEEEVRLESLLRKGLEQEEFVLHYQPIIDLRTGKIAGMESLVRWNSPESGLVPPMKFIPVLEQTGMIIAVGEWILKSSLEQTARWIAAGYRELKVSINISSLQLDQPDFVEMVRAVVHDSGVPPANIGLEITESLLIENMEVKKKRLQELKASLGLSISMDDFGTGYSSLSYLRELPLDVIKIDRSFITNITKDPNSLSILSAIISMSHSLDMSVIAEGVETREQLQLLKLLKCDRAQGYLMSRPVPPADFERLLREGIPEKGE